MPWTSIDPAWILRLLKDTAAVTWTTDVDGHIVMDIPEWERLTGQASEEVSGDGWMDALHPDDVARVRAAWSTAVEHGSPYNTDYRIRCADGIHRWFNARGTPILNREGEITAWVGMCLVIPGAHRAAEGHRPRKPATASAFDDIRPAALRAARAMLNWSASDLAAAAGVSLSTVRRLEADEPPVQSRPANVRRIIDCLSRAGIDLLGDDGTVRGVACREAAAEDSAADSDWLDVPAGRTLQ